MKTIRHDEIIIPAYDETIYEYEELTPEAKNNVKKWLLDEGETQMRTNIFYEDIRNDLAEEYPSSTLDVQFDIYGGQGSGLNIYGELNAVDFLPKWGATAEDKKIIADYLNVDEFMIPFTCNDRYTYSCKFLDAKNAEYTAEEYAEYLPEGCNIQLITQFIKAAYNYFDDMEAKYYESGAEYIYLTDEKILEEEAAPYMFTEAGKMVYEYGTYIG